jgi:hypothetical protein
MTYESTKIREALDQALADFGIESDELRHYITFHMTDWLDELNSYSHFCADPSSFESSDAQSLLLQFLTHVPNHLAAASKLLLGIPVTDVFDVGAVSDTDS